MKNLHKTLTKEMTELAREEVEAYLVWDRDLYVFGSESACRRVQNQIADSTAGARLNFTTDPWYQCYLTVPDYY